MNSCSSQVPGPWSLDRVVVRSRSQIVKPDALFDVFLGIRWAHDIVKKSIMISWVFLALKFWPFLQGKTAQKEQFFKIGLFLIQKW